ncbi:hypothetical protein K438DRAFT_2000778 [Mycena galopus ATCC 62051]|nr:hypothetical protein K438DRAFT_2000778 [Mycena galopus ATCC 62051]
MDVGGGYESAVRSLRHIPGENPVGNERAELGSRARFGVGCRFLVFGVPGHEGSLKPPSAELGSRARGGAGCRFLFFGVPGHEGSLKPPNAPAFCLTGRLPQKPCGALRQTHAPHPLSFTASRPNVKNTTKIAGVTDHTVLYIVSTSGGMKSAGNWVTRNKAAWTYAQETLEHLSTLIVQCGGACRANG